MQCLIVATTMLMMEQTRTAIRVVREAMTQHLRSGIARLFPRKG